MENKKEPLTTKVTAINNIFHCRVYNGEKVIVEMACKIKQDIGYCFRYMLRMIDKCGSSSNMADASRHRGRIQEPVGKIWYPSQLPIK